MISTISRRCLICECATLWACLLIISNHIDKHPIHRFHISAWCLSQYFCLAFNLSVWEHDWCGTWVGFLFLLRVLNSECCSTLLKLPGFFFRYLWARVFGGRPAGSVAVTTRDYEQFVGWKLSAQKHEIILATAQELEEVYCLTFQDGLPVTPRNVSQYLQTMQDNVAASREPELELLVAGFQDPALVAVLEVLRRRHCTWNELRRLLTGTPAC